MSKIRKLLHKYRDILAYMFFGGLTTLVNYAVYLPCYNLLFLPAVVSNILAWVVSVLFSFFTNKPFVFRSHNWSARVLWPELIKFVSCRALSGLLETTVLFVTVDILGWNGNYLKLIVSVLVVFINYFASKWVVFRARNQK